MTDVAHSEHEPTPFERFEQLARNILIVNKKEVESLSKKEEKSGMQDTRSSEKAE